MQQAPPQIFDYSRRRALRERAERRAGRPFLWNLLAEDLADRLAFVSRSFDRCLFLGPLAIGYDDIVAGKAIETVPIRYAEEDRLGVEPASFDLIVAAGALDSINDLPGALVQIRRALRPDGLFLGAMFGAGTLAGMKRAMMSADGARAAAHIHPQVELRAAADLLTRAGFTMPVADRIGAEVRYTGWRQLVGDLREAGIGNCLSGNRRFLGRQYPAKLDDAWNHMVDTDGKVAERFEFLHLSGWSPSPSQPRPAQRGSGQVSLVKLLDKSNEL